MKRLEKAEKEKKGIRSNFCIIKIKIVHPQTAAIFDKISTGAKF